MKKASIEKLKNLVEDMNIEDKKKVAEAIIEYATKEKENALQLESILNKNTEIKTFRKGKVKIQEIQRLIFELDEDDWSEKSKKEKMLILEEKMGIDIDNDPSKLAKDDDEQLLTY